MRIADKQILHNQEILWNAFNLALTLLRNSLNKEFKFILFVFKLLMIIENAYLKVRKIIKADGNLYNCKE